MEEQQNQSTLTHLLQYTLRSFCIHHNSQWIYAVFWRILPRNYPPPKWDTQSAFDRSRGNRRNWILAWEDGFCNFAATTTGETTSGDSPAYANHEYQQYLGLQPELFFKMSHEIYNYGEGLIGKVAADHSHKWITTEPTDQEINLLSNWNNSADSYPRTWEAQFQAGIKTIALVAVREGVIQLGSINKVVEDLSYIVMLRKKLSYIESIPGVLLPHPSSSLCSLKASEPYNITEAWRFYGDNSGGELPAVYNQPMNITPSMSSLEALLSKLPAVVPVSSPQVEAPPYGEVAQPHFVAVVSPEEEDVEIKDMGECSSSMSSYGHHH